MAEFPALPLWTDAYLGDTTHLTTIEHGAYLLLLMTAWRTRDCALPDDDRLLARYTRLNAKQWARMRPILEPFFVSENGQWRQRRLTDEAQAVRQRKEAAAANGRASALKRQGRHSTEREQSVNGSGAKRQRESNLTSTNNQEEVPLDKESNGALPDPEKLMFDHGVAYLGAQGIAESRARPMLGKWKRDHGAGQVIEALSRAKREGAIEPVAFIEGCLRAAVRTQPEPLIPI